MKSRTVFSDCEKYATVYTRFIHFLPVDFSSFPQQFISFSDINCSSEFNNSFWVYERLAK